MEWHRIDGKKMPKGEVLLYYPPKIFGRIAHGEWITVGYATTKASRNPTHWMPLPPAPQTET